MSMLAEQIEAVIGVDTHRHTHTAAMLDAATGAVLARVTVRADPDGYAELSGRSDDVITSSAYRIGPFEVESALVEHPAVMEAAVGKPDPGRPEIVIALVILAPGGTPSDELARELQDHVKTVTLRTSTAGRSTSWTSYRRRSAGRSAGRS